MAEYPILIQRQYGGWIAKGHGWAVDGPTRDEAISRYHEAEVRHAEIDAQPFIYERLRQDSAAQQQRPADQEDGR